MVSGTSCSALLQLLQRFYAQLHASNPALLNSAGKRYTIAPPQILREGNKKSIFANVSDICKRMHRQPEHVIQYMFAEMGTTGSVDGSGRLVIKGRFQQKQIEHVLRRYIGTPQFSTHGYRLTPCGSRVRYMQDVQIARHSPQQGEPYFLHVVRVVRVEAFRRDNQDWFPGASGEEKQKQDRLIGWIRHAWKDAVAYHALRICTHRISLHSDTVYYLSFTGQGFGHGLRVIWLALLGELMLSATCDILRQSRSVYMYNATPATGACREGIKNV